MAMSMHSDIQKAISYLQKAEAIIEAVDRDAVDPQEREELDGLYNRLDDLIDDLEFFNI